MAQFDKGKRKLLKIISRKEPNLAMLEKYSLSDEMASVIFFKTLSEKNRRLYAATEASELGYGGITYISNLFNIDRKTIYRGISEIRQPDTIETERVRAVGGGRKDSLDINADIDKKFFEVLHEHTAGDPMDENIRWTNLTHEQVANKLVEKGVCVSRKIVRRLFRKHGFKKRKMQKTVSIGDSENRNEQFENISDSEAIHTQAGNPIISMDTKKKELLGNLYRDGILYTLGVQEVFDHDFPHLADGIVIPHGIYDITKNKAYINIGTSRDTSEFACDSIREWWYDQGSHDYPAATSILVLCDSGGSNSYRHYIFKEDLQKLADEIGMEIRIAHYPPYTSKWNPIGHRLFCHITKSLKGVILKNYDIVKELMESTTTKTGLTVLVNIIKKTYDTGRKYTENFKETMRIKFDEKLGKWNYRAIPLTS